MTIKRGDIYYADLSPVVGSEQGGVRPVLIVQNDVGNKFSPTVIAAAITSQKYKTNLPTHIQVHANDCGLAKDSIVLLEQVRTLDKRRLRERMGNLAPDDMNRINRALSVSFGLGPRGEKTKPGIHKFPAFNLSSQRSFGGRHLLHRRRTVRLIPLFSDAMKFFFGFALRF